MSHPHHAALTVVIPGGGVFIDGQVASLIARLLGDWPHEYGRQGLPAEHWGAVQEAIGAMRAAAVISAARRGKEERQGKSAAALSAPWLSTAQVADATGYSARRARQLKDEGLIEAKMFGGRLMYPPATIDRVRKLRRGS